LEFHDRWSFLELPDCERKMPSLCIREQLSAAAWGCLPLSRTETKPSSHRFPNPAFASTLDMGCNHISALVILVFTCKNNGADAVIEDVVCRRDTLI